ncbi:hypothetical protein PS1_036520 [Malus domestica]
MVTKSLSNISFIIVPSNSLNIKSKNLSFGSWRNTRGNFLAKRLLLKLRSNSSLRRLNLWGTVPQNLLESMWNYARSVSSLSSSGKYLVMSPPRLGCLWTASSDYAAVAIVATARPQNIGIVDSSADQSRLGDFPRWANVATRKNSGGRRH